MPTLQSFRLELFLSETDMFIEVKTQTGPTMVNLNNVELIETFTRGGEEYVVFTLIKTGSFHTREDYETIKQRIKNLGR